MAAVDPQWSWPVMQKYRVFLSHRFTKQDPQRADAIERALSGLSPNIEIYNPGTDIATSSTWREEICKELAKSDMLLMLYSDPREDWAWCSYEAGLFSRLDGDGTDQDPIVVIHYDKLSPPSQLNHLQCLEARPDRVQGFLHDLFRTTEITRARWPLDSRIADADLDESAKAICSQFRKPDQFYATYRLELALPVDSTRQTVIPMDAKVVSATPGTLHLFGLSGDTDRFWGDLVASQADTDWLDEINEAFTVCAERRIPEPGKRTFRPPRGSEIVRPSIFRVDSYDGQPHVVCVIFNLEPSPGKVGGRVFNMLRSLERNRTELIERFVDRSEPSDPILSSDYELDAIAVASELINDETIELGVFDHRILNQCFPDASVVEKLSEIGKKWHDSSSRMHAAIEAADRTVILETLLEISGFVDQFAKIASNRYAEMVSKRLQSPAAASRQMEKPKTAEVEL
jgi:hypothetical protein